MTTSDPASASRNAHARPIPLEAPVTSDTRPFRSIMVALRCLCGLFRPLQRAGRSDQHGAVTLCLQDGASVLTEESEVETAMAAIVAVEEQSHDAHLSRPRLTSDSQSPHAVRDF